MFFLDHWLNAYFPLGGKFILGLVWHFLHVLFFRRNWTFSFSGGEGDESFISRLHLSFLSI